MTQEAAAPTLREAPTGRDMFLAYCGKADAGVWDILLPTTREAWERCAALAARPADPVEPTDEAILNEGEDWQNAANRYKQSLATPAEPATLPSSRERWNAENPGELSLHTFDDDATPASPKEPTAREPAGASERDAARYRWLRNFAFEPDWMSYWEKEPEALDAAIDAAIEPESAKP